MQHLVHDLQMLNVSRLSQNLKKYFPKEVRQKQIEYEIEAGKEQFGVLYTHPSESRCSLM